MSQGWDPLQHAALEAMGLSPLRRVAPERPPVDPLLARLLLIAGCEPGGEEAADLARAWPPPARLRGDGAEKRRLWPQLRALRRRHRAGEAG